MFIASGDKLGVGLGESGAVAACPRLGEGGGIIFSRIDEVGIERPNKVVCLAGFCFGIPVAVGVCQSSRLLTEVELLEFLLRPADPYGLLS